MTAHEYPGPRTTKLRGRPKGSRSDHTNDVRDALGDLPGQFDRMTVRGAFYQLAAHGVVAKDEGGYRIVQRQVLAMRKDGSLSWEFIADGTRWMRKPSSYANAGTYAELVAQSYRRDLWQSQGVRLEIWLEKDALAGVVADVTSRWDVPLMVSRGQSSATFLYSAAQAALAGFAERGLATYIYSLYDYDAGGDRAWRTIERDLPEYALGVPIHFKRLAVTPSQIVEWDLPTRPAKATDPEAKRWDDKPAVELDAIPPDRLLALVEEAIIDHIDSHAWSVEQTAEAEEKRSFVAFAQAWRNGGAGQ